MEYKGYYLPHRKHNTLTVKIIRLMVFRKIIVYSENQLELCGLDIKFFNFKPASTCIITTTHEMVNNVILCLLAYEVCSDICEQFTFN
jgi:hypothetical protein